MACHYFGAVKFDDPDFVNIINGWSTSCVADGKHPRGNVNGNMLVLYCCDRATDTPPVTVPAAASRITPVLATGFIVLGIASLVVGAAMTCATDLCRARHLRE